MRTLLLALISLGAAASDWDSIAAVLRHPRCLNCHTITDFPRQGDSRQRHQQLVMRGEHDSGVRTLQCASCHQSTSSFEEKVPGAPDWKLAPLSMGWEDLSDAALCRSIKSKLTLPKLVDHMVNAPLVQWAWLQKARTRPPLSQAEFHSTFQRWAAAGAACPQ